MIVNNLLVPSTPLLLPSVGQEAQLSLIQTRTALARLARELRLIKPQTIVIICESAQAYPAAVTILAADPYSCSLLVVGDLGYRKQYHPDFALLDKMQRSLRHDGIGLTMDTEASLPIEMIAGLELITTDLTEKYRIIPIVLPKFISAREALTLGEIIAHLVDEGNSRVTTVVATDLEESLGDTFKTILAEKSLALYNSTFADKAIDQTLGAGALGVFLGIAHSLDEKVDVLHHAQVAESAMIVAEASFI